MHMKSVLRTFFVLLCVFGRTSVAAPLPQYANSDYEVTPYQTQEGKKSFQRSLSGLYSVNSWTEQNITQPYSNFNQLYHAATNAQQELDVLAREIALHSNTQALVPAVKSAERAKEKIKTELQGETHRITDLARCSLVANDIPSLMQSFELLNKEVSVVAVKNRFKSPTASGYRDFKLLVRLPKSQVIAEVQLHLEAISTVKNGAEHKIYEEIQRIERTSMTEERNISEFELAQIAKLRAESLNLYQTAWQQYLQPETMAV